MTNIKNNRQKYFFFCKMQEKLSPYIDWAKSHVTLLSGLALYTVVVYILLLVGLLPVYQQTRTEIAAQKFFPLIVLVILGIYCFLDVRNKQIGAK